MKYTEQELQDKILEAKVEENIFWLSKAHFMAARKHEERINQLIAKHGYIDENGGIDTKHTGGDRNRNADTVPA